MAGEKKSTCFGMSGGNISWRRVNIQAEEKRNSRVWDKWKNS
jgi:hypothetical protein